MFAPRTTVLIVLACIGATNVLPAAAQTVAKPGRTDPPNDKSGTAKNALASGTQAFEAGKTDAAIAALSTAITSGGLQNSDLAKAMFYRGVAYRKQRKPGAALSDLNAAVWLRDGLSATDKAVAEDHRQAVLREVAGLGAPAAAPDPVAVAAVVPVAPPAKLEPSIAAPVLPQPPIAPVVASAQPEPATLPWLSTAVPSQAAPTPAAAVKVEARVVEAAPATTTSMKAEPDTISTAVASVAPVERAQIATVQAEPAPPEKQLPWQTAGRDTPPVDPPTLSWATAATPTSPSASLSEQKAATNTAALPQPQTAQQTVTAALADSRVATDPASTEAASASSIVPSSLNDMGKAAGALLGNLFSGSSAPSAEPIPSAPVKEEQAPPPSSSVETASISNNVERPQTAPVVWSSETHPAPLFNPGPEIEPGVDAAAQPQVTKTEPTPQSDATPVVAILPGPYRLQIAAENTRADAEQTLARLIAKHTPSLRGLEPVIEEPTTGGILFGSMGAAYRVSLGPYATSVEPSRLCNILTAHGFDCRVVTVTP